MSRTMWVALGAAVSILFVGVVGLLAIQVMGRRGGVVFGLDNVPVAVQPPHMPYLPIFTIAAVSTLVMCSLTVFFRKNCRRSRVFFVSGFTVATAVLIVLSFVIAPSAETAANDLLLGVLHGWQGWIEQGGVNPAVHVLFFLSVGSLWLYPGPRQAAPHRDEAADTTGLTVSGADDA